jgi:hypothetical protein
MLNSQLQAATLQSLLHSVSAANTAAATSAWKDVRGNEGDIAVLVDVGAMTGSITWTIEDATDGAGTGGATFSSHEGAFTAGAANQNQKRTFRPQETRGFVRVVGTIGTGPSVVSAVLVQLPKNY